MNLYGLNMVLHQYLCWTWNLKIVDSQRVKLHPRIVIRSWVPKGAVLGPLAVILQDSSRCGWAVLLSIPWLADPPPGKLCHATAACPILRGQSNRVTWPWTVKLQNHEPTLASLRHKEFVLRWSRLGPNIYFLGTCFLLKKHFKYRASTWLNQVIRFIQRVRNTDQCGLCCRRVSQNVKGWRREIASCVALGVCLWVAREQAAMPEAKSPSQKRWREQPPEWTPH